MMNSTSNFSSTQLKMSLDQLLDTLGFNEWITMTASFILPSTCLVGIVLCSLGVFIFFKSRFVNPIFFYYRLLCLVYIIHLAHVILHGLFFSPKYFPRLNTYSTSMYHVYFLFCSAFLYHFEGGLQIAILFDRLRVFSPFVKRHFSACTPLFVTISLLFTCLFIDVPFLFAFKVKSFGCYYYLGKDYTFYYFEASDFSQTLTGQILLGFSQIILNQMLTLCTGILLNIVYIHKYKSYLTQRKRQINDYEMGSIHYKHHRHREIELLSSIEGIKRRIEKNMLYMGLTLCSISILSRVVLIVCHVGYFYFRASFQFNLRICVFVSCMFSLVPTLAIFVFFSFNTMFRQEIVGCVFCR